MPPDGWPGQERATRAMPRKAPAAVGCVTAHRPATNHPRQRPSTTSSRDAPLALGTVHKPRSVRRGGVDNTSTKRQFPSACVAFRASPSATHPTTPMKIDTGGTPGTKRSGVTGVVRKARGSRKTHGHSAARRGHGTPRSFSSSGASPRHDNSVVVPPLPHGRGSSVLE